ncbi:TldD/PmbA family protein [Sphingomonas sp. Y38-1Y]|uniref:TldD/PmbA family protein n=1 Tax=Sphingomonas sp. Y38-1Y TaxID=3078265 RepID=UPI0028E91C86|nr:TldD/PmbA family protein [Sphingomonas sp. Y38-1Y]
MLTVSQAVEIAARAAERARAAGADAADASVAGDQSTGIGVRLGHLEEIDRSEGESLSLRAFVGRRVASVSSSRMTDADLDRLAERVVAMAKAAPEDPYAGLAPQDRLMHGSAPDLDLHDGGAVEPDRLRDLALAAEDAARGVEGITNSDGAGASARETVSALATSHGFAGGYRTTSYSLSASVIAGTGERMQGGDASHSARYLAQLEAADIIGRRAGERAVERLDPVQVESGPLPIVFDRRVSASLIGHFTAAIAGAAVARGTSFLKDRLGKPVFAEGVTICDDPQRPRGLRSRSFDGEGLPVSPVTLVDRGVLQTWLLDSAAARQLGLEPTGHAARGGGVSTSNVHMAAGTIPVETLLGEVDRGIYVTELIGQGVNAVTGDYSRGVAGFLIEGGELVRPVAGITVAGNLLDMYRALTPASDLEFRYGVNAPTIRIDGMTVAGG